MILVVLEVLGHKVKFCFVWNMRQEAGDGQWGQLQVTLSVYDLIRDSDLTPSG